MDKQFFAGIGFDDFHKSLPTPLKRPSSDHGHDAKRLKDSTHEGDDDDADHDDEGAEEEEGDEEEEEEEPTEGELLAKAVTGGKVFLGKIEKATTLMMEDISKTTGKARADSCRVAAECMKEQFESQKTKLRQAITKSQPDKGQLDDLAQETQDLLDECKVVHAEFKPHPR